MVDEVEAFPTEADVDDALTEFNGDARATIRALLADLDAVIRDHGRSVSRGFVRGIAIKRLPPSKRSADR